jgi:broad specificity phosphatase PhoE
MRKTIRVALTALAAAGVGPAAAQSAAPEPITVFVVRHAEKGPENPDPSLTAEGRARAAALAHVLGDAGIGAVFVSEFKRTQETAEPLARRLGIAPARLEAAKLAELASRLRALPPGSRALVVSHSNLMGSIVERLSGVKIGALTDADYDRLYVVTVRPADGGPGGVTYLHFGKPAGG